MRSHQVRPIGFFLLGVVAFTTGVCRAGAATEAVDHHIYAELLSKHVAAGRVDYAGFKADETRLDQYLAVLEKVDPQRLAEPEQFAFYINAYNAWTIKLILSAYPGVRSIKDLGGLFQSPWKKEFVRIDGKVVTLDHVEHDILRPRFRDPRVHFAVNCASKSCPPLLSEPYRGSVLDAQLTRVTTGFLNQPSNSRLEGDQLWVSAIFKWFAEDFNEDVVGFYMTYAQDDLKRKLEAARNRIKIRYMDYDWSLNGE